jgi:hypothetical protein
MLNNRLDILFVSNYSDNLNATEDIMRQNMPSDLKCEILTYRDSAIKDSYSYEQYIEKNYEIINSYEIKDLNRKFKGINFSSVIAAERLISDYYGLDGILGHKRYSLQDLNFIIKSWVLFLDPFIQKSEIIFSGYADNLISHLTLILSSFYNKKCISFGPKNVINHETNYLVSGIYSKPLERLKNNNKFTESSKLCEYIKNYDMKKQVTKAYKSNNGLSKPIFGFISRNVIKKTFWRFIIFGYKTSDHRVRKYLEIDRVSLFYKLLAYAKKFKNKIFNKVYINFLQKKLPDTDFIYFPLQVQPEASTSVTSPYFMNLKSTIEYISKSLPLGYTLVVKEHPAMKGMRSTGFYRRINSLPNVELVHPGINSKKIIKESSLIIGFGGTTLLEAIYLGRKILIFQDSFYSDSKLVKKVLKVRSLNSEILGFLELNISKNDAELELEKMLNFFYQRGFPRYDNFEKNMAENLVKVYLEGLYI